MTSRTGTCAAAAAASGGAPARTTRTSASAYDTLYTALVTVAKLLAPFTPFVAEELYRNLVVSDDASRADQRPPRGRGRSPMTRASTTA